MTEQAISEISDHFANFIVEVGYEGKAPFFVGTFVLERAQTREGQMEAAQKAAAGLIERFWAEHMLDETPPPKVLDVKLAALRCIPDDYEWRRG